jgi:hypothetical protein
VNVESIKRRGDTLVDQFMQLCDMIKENVRRFANKHIFSVYNPESLIKNFAVGCDVKHKSE